MDSLFILSIPHLILVLFEFILIFSVAGLDRLTPANALSDGMTMASGDGTFEVGFFSPGTSRGRYLGIWFKNIPVKTVVWVANRVSPINDSSGLLNIDGSGNLVLLSGNGTGNRTVVWSGNSSKVSRSPIVQLLDTGNLVLRDGNDSNAENYLWQSFDYPTDTLIPEMKLGWDLRRRLDRRLSAWKNENDPSPGDFTWGIDHLNYPEFIALKGNQKYFRSGPWNGLEFSGAPEQRQNQLFSFNFFNNGDEVCYSYNQNDKSTLSRIVLNQSNNYARERYAWSESTLTWQLYATVPRDHCDNYGLCGPNGNCDTYTLPICKCLNGFSPVSVSPNKGNSLDWNWTEGCKRNEPLKCDRTDGFVRFTELKLPDTAYAWVDKIMEIRECRDRCLKNCSCTAYTHSDIRGAGSGCVMWFGDLLDIRRIPAGGQDLFIRMPASELGAKDKHRVKIAVAAVSAIVGLAVLLLTAYKIRKLRKKHGETSVDVQEKLEKIGSTEQGKEDSDLELPTFNLATISKATSNFSVDNKLGEGGFGPVYKGTLADGQEIAVKRLSSSSGQGLKEFKNEVIFIAKLQHRNLVRVLGCCIQGEEKMLIYEYMPNRSLDAFIFDNTKSHLLDWHKRFNIIGGIARGLLYLHQDSRLRIIHRDLKASNVLLDKEMNPKISDFGMARTFGGDQSEGNTKRVVGTYGYMAPEYAIDGLFSVKSDVFSFGILVLEIVSGRRSRGIFHSSQNLIGHAWRLFAEGKPLELTDPCVESSCNVHEVMRCIHVSFLCLQHHPEDRPSMASVVLMLGSEGTLPPPKQPGFLIDRSPFDTSTSSKPMQSINEITVTQVEAR